MDHKRNVRWKGERAREKSQSHVVGVPFFGPPPAAVLITKIAYERPGSFCMLTNAQKTLPEVPQPASGRAGIHTRQAGP